MSQSLSQSKGVLPPCVRANDTVAVCSPAGPVPAARLGAGIARLESRYRVRWDDGALAATGYLAGDDDRRADELNRYLRDPDVRAIVLSRGGYGIMRILDHLDAAALRADPKLIVGFSDATALLSWALGAAGVRGIHGPVAAQLGELGREDVDWLFRMMEASEPAGVVPASLGSIGSACAGVREGRLLGGNLCIVSHLVGTAYELPLGGAVFLLEDVGERPYAIDRYLTGLSLAGALDATEVAIVGDFVACEETKMSPRPDVWDVIDERLGSFGIAGLRGLPVGHGSRNLALPFGARCVADQGAGRFELLEAAVARG